MSDLTRSRAAAREPVDGARGRYVADTSLETQRVGEIVTAGVQMFYSDHFIRVFSPGGEASVKLKPSCLINEFKFSLNSMLHSILNRQKQHNYPCSVIHAATVILK